MYIKTQNFSNRNMNILNLYYTIVSHAVSIVSYELISRVQFSLTQLCAGLLQVYEKVPSFNILEPFLVLLNILSWCCFEQSFSLLYVCSHTDCMFLPLLSNYFIKCFYIIIYSLSKLCKNITFWLDKPEGSYSLLRKKFFHVQLY